ncbi:MAG: flagellar export protein FliJ [Peptostreptococcaceae bacterium]
MNKFKFRLQKVLDIKVKNEEEVKIKYSKTQGEKVIVEKELESLKSNYDKYSNINKIDDVITQKITANYLNSLSYSIDLANKELQEKQRELKEVKEELINKQIERKSLEKLKENKFKSYKKEEERKEQNENDEFAIYSYFRNRANVG